MEKLYITRLTNFYSKKEARPNQLHSWLCDEEVIDNIDLSISSFIHFLKSGNYTVNLKNNTGESSIILEIVSPAFPDEISYFFNTLTNVYYKAKDSSDPNSILQRNGLKSLENNFSFLLTYGTTRNNYDSAVLLKDCSFVPSEKSISFICNDIVIKGDMNYQTEDYKNTSIQQEGRRLFNMSKVYNYV